MRLLRTLKYAYEIIFFIFEIEIKKAFLFRILPIFGFFSSSSSSPRPIIRNRIDLDTPCIVVYAMYVTTHKAHDRNAEEELMNIYVYFSHCVTIAWPLLYATAKYEHAHEHLPQK